MADIANYKIQFKSDFVLTIHGDAGWMTPFCIKFWTGVPSRAYFVGWDGKEYINCKVDETDASKLIVLFDDHQLPVGQLKMQMAYHTTIEDFPGSVFDEVTNASDVIVDIEGTEYHVMLDVNGETAPEIEFNLPAYEAEAERQRAEQQRQTNEQARNDAEALREQAESKRQQDTGTAIQKAKQATLEAENVNARLSSEGGAVILTITNRQGNQTSKEVGFRIAKTYPNVAAMNADLANVEEGRFVMIAGDVEQTDTGKLYVKGATGFTFLVDLSGAKGIKGDAFTYADFTPEQIAELQRPATEAAALAEQKATEAGRVNASLSGTLLTVTDRNGNSVTQDVQGPKGEPGAQGDPSTADINLNGTVVTVTNNAGEVRSVDVSDLIIHKADKTVVVDGSTLPASLEPNKVYQLGTLTGSVTIPAFASVQSGDTEAKIWCFTFSTGATAPTITWPAGITGWSGGSAPTINASKSYEVTVMDGIGVLIEA